MGIATFCQGKCQLSAKEKCTCLRDSRMGEGNDTSMVYMRPLREHRLKTLLTSLLVTFPKGWPVWSLTARVQRGESSTARCASTGD